MPAMGIGPQEGKKRLNKRLNERKRGEKPMGLVVRRFSAWWRVERREEGEETA
jgi:hypothetical protein